MSYCDRLLCRRAALRRLALAGLAAALVLGPPARAAEPPPLRLDGVRPGGLRISATESWGTFEFDLANLTAADRPARLAVLFEGRPGVQYARDVWVPAHSTVASWMLVGP